ncbi:MAG: TldD/PmbA family protein [Rhodospirillaceae bacterium]
MSVQTETDADLLDRLQDVIRCTVAAGADAADVVYAEGTSLSMAYRMGKPETLDRAEGMDLGLRALIGRRQAIVSSSDTSEAALAELIDRAVAMAKVVPEDEFCGLAPEDLIAGEVPDLDECDPAEPDAATLEDRAKRAENSARAVAGVTNSEGAEAGWSRSRVAVAASNGFARVRVRSGHSISAAVLAGEGTGMERDYDWAQAVHAEDLRSPEEIGRTAGENAVKRLRPRKISTAQVPVVYDPRVSQSLLAHLAGAVNGSAVARGTTFLRDAMGTKVFADAITVTDDPLRRRGLRSKAFDGEGVATRTMNIIENGALMTWVLDLRSARQLGLETTGNASRGTSSPPSPSTTNLYMEPGPFSPAELIADIKQGLYVTGMMGRGANMVTGDYSRGAEGFWIENGEIAYPVSELTIAGNLKDMFKNLTPASDLAFRYGTNAPTSRIDGMTVAGK